jgi:uncharacterized protein (DUF1697 family)
MAVIIAMLRGVNLGKRRVKMVALRALFESLGLREVQTLVQSGNVAWFLNEIVNAPEAQSVPLRKAASG